MASEARDRQARIGPADEAGADRRVTFLRACFNGETEIVREMIYEARGHQTPYRWLVDFKGDVGIMKDIRMNNTLAGDLPESWVITGFRGACLGGFTETAKLLMRYFTPRPETFGGGLARGGNLVFDGTTAGDGTASDLLVYVAIAGDDEFLLDFISEHKRVLASPTPSTHNLIGAVKTLRVTMGAETVRRAREVLGPYFDQSSPLDLLGEPSPANFAGNRIALARALGLS